MENNRRWTDGLTAEINPEEKLAKDGKGLALKAALTGTPVNDISLGRKDEDEETKDKLRTIAKEYLARMGNLTIVEAEPNAAIREATMDKKEKTLSPEETGRILGAIQSRFEANMNRHKGLNWAKVEAGLKADPEALWSFAQMETAGHAPDVHNYDEEGFDVGTCSEESPESGRNCVFDEEAAALLRKNAPNEIFNGSAVEQAKAMGITLMSEDQYRNLQKSGKFDRNTISWLLTQSNIRSTGGALYGFRDVGGVGVYRAGAFRHSVNRAWRGSRRVKFVEA